MVKRVRREFELSAPQNDVMTSRLAIIADIAGQGSGKTVVIGLIVGWMVTKFPEAKGFIGANTNAQLSGSTLSRVFHVLETVYRMTEYDAQSNPGGQYVVGKQPPKNAGWKKANFKFKHYNDIMIFKNGAVVFLGSLENYKAHDGKEFAWAHLDETKDTKKDALTAVILGRLRQYGLWVHEATGNPVWAPLINAEIAKRQGLRSWNPCYIHTSPAEGTVDWLIDLLGIKNYEKEIRQKITKGTKSYFHKVIGNTSVTIYPTHFNAHNLPPDYIVNRKQKLTLSEILKFICGYPFGRNGGEYYPTFDRFKHVGKYPYIKGLPIATAWDFNAVPYVTALCAHVRYITRYYDRQNNKKYSEWQEGLEPMEVINFRFFREYCLENPLNTTEHTANAIADDYEKDSPDMFVDGDASGHSRIEGLGSLTNYKIIAQAWANRFYLAEGWLRAKKVNIQVRKRKDLLVKIFGGKIPEIEIEIDEENCPNLIRDCEYLLQGADGGKHKELEKDANGVKFQKLGHPSDAMEYLIAPLCAEFIKEDN